MILEGKVALVTGSTSGIGLAIARALTAEGAKVMLNGFGDAAEIDRIKTELGALHDGADLSDPAQIEAMVRHCTDELGAPDILVNNAGIQHPNKSAYVAAKHGVAGFTKAVALEAAKDGVTVNCISPGYVWTTLVENQIPDTMKARGLTREQVMNDVLLAAQPTKRFVTPEEVAALALFLCPDEAKSITGANLSMDGGWTAA